MSNLTTIASNAANAEASQIVGTFNTLITNINSGTAGQLFANVATGATTAAATTQTLQTYTLPAGYLTQTRSGLRIRIWGTTAATAGTKAVSMVFGGTTFVLFAANAFSNAATTFWGQLDIYRTGAATNRVFGTGLVGVTPVAMAYTAGTDDHSTALTISATAANGAAVANETSIYAMIGEVIQ